MNMKHLFQVVYIVGACFYTIRDIITSYGDDNIIFWVLIRPLLASIKGLLWPIIMWF
jgi:hypothetical protein